MTAVQLCVDPGMYASASSFSEGIHSLVASAVSRYRPDLIVFPEYTGVFAAAVSTGLGPLEDSRGLPGLLEHPEKVLGVLDPGAVSAPDFFARHDPSVLLDQVFGAAAAFHGIHIIAGTYFAPVPVAGVSGPGTRVVNRAVVYGPDGKRVYEQDKVFLTPFEEELLGLAPGTLDAVRTFAINGVELGLTVCRDSFFPDWENHFSGIDLWIDIKANGVPFDSEQEAVFRRALPARIASSGVPAGMTVCLTGRFFGLMWEGRSSVVIPRGPAGVTVLTEAESPSIQTFLPFTFLSLEYP